MTLSFDVRAKFSNEFSNLNHMTCANSRILYSIMFLLVTSLIGNVLLIPIVYKREELRRTTNYLAVSDLMFSLVAIISGVLAIVNSSWQNPTDCSTAVKLPANLPGFWKAFRSRFPRKASFGLHWIDLWRWSCR